MGMGKDGIYGGIWKDECPFILVTNILFNTGIPCRYLGFGPSSVQFSSVAQSCPTLCDPMNHSTPGLLVHHHLLEFTQTHVYRVRDAFEPSHPLSSPAPPALNPSQHQGLLKCQFFPSGDQSIGVSASVLPVNIQE